MFNIQKFQSKINKKYPQENLTVLEYNGTKGFTKIKCNTCGQTYEYNKGENITSKKKKVLCHNCIDSLKSKQRCQQSLANSFPYDDLQIIKYGRNKNDPGAIKCNKCGTVVSFSSITSGFKRHKYFCKVCHPLKYDILQDKILKFKNFIESSNQWELITSLIDISDSNSLIACKCIQCNNITSKTMNDYLKGRGCIFCSGNKLKTTEEFKQQLDEDYKLLDEYINANTKVTLKHDCGFIYKVTPHNYLTGKRCPKCMRKQSKGEHKIEKYLINNEILYEQEYQVFIEGHCLRFDFYLPTYDLFIEYQGIQHFQPVEFFGGVARFMRQQEYDILKQRYFKNILVIDYTQYKDIDEILNKNLRSSTTIPEGSTLQAIGGGSGKLL